VMLVVLDDSGVSLVEEREREMDGNEDGGVGDQVYWVFLPSREER